MAKLTADNVATGWPDGWAWRFTWFGRTGTVALGSAVISYGHVRDLLLG